MQAELQNIGPFVREIYSSGHGSALYMGTASTSNYADWVGTIFDRLSLSRRYRGAFVAVKADFANLASSAIVTVRVGLQHADASSVGAVWTDVGARVTKTAGTAVSSDAAPTNMVAQASFDITGAKRYIRPVFELVGVASATSSGPTITPQTWDVILTGPDEAPSESWATPSSSQV